MSRILVTGGSGFIGSGLVKALVRAGHRVRVLDDNSRGSPHRLTEVANDIEFIAGDIRIGPTGSVIARGYDLKWFVSSLDPDYLAEKFLSTRRPGSGVSRQKWDVDVGWLSVVQQKFRELYERQLASVTAACVEE